MRTKRLMAGVYEITLGSRVFLVTHDPERGRGYEWMAECPEEGTADVAASTLNGLKEQLATVGEPLWKVFGFGRTAEEG